MVLLEPTTLGEEQGGMLSRCLEWGGMLSRCLEWGGITLGMPMRPGAPGGGGGGGPPIDDGGSW